MTVYRNRPVDVKVKMTKELHQWLKTHAKENYRTLSAEINMHLEQAMKNYQAKDNKKTDDTRQSNSSAPVQSTNI